MVRRAALVSNQHFLCACLAGDRRSVSVSPFYSRRSRAIRGRLSPVLLRASVSLWRILSFARAHAPGWFRALAPRPARAMFQRKLLVADGRQLWRVFLDVIRRVHPHVVEALHRLWRRPGDLDLRNARRISHSNVLPNRIAAKAGA